MKTRNESRDKIEVYERKYLILEKIGTSGEIKILPRDFTNHQEALDYLKDIDRSMEEGLPELHKKVRFYIVMADEVKFL